MIGKTIAHYRISEKLGEGGMGEVYLAEDTELDRKVALKFLPPQYTEDPDINLRFKHEAKAAAALNHPNIITIYEIGEDEGRTYIAMEYVEGHTLAQVSNLRKVLDYTTQICEGLAAAHKNGIVHRDIKPANILIGKDGRVKIADFGLAKSRARTKLTAEGSTLGTLDYMSPEQLSGAEVDQRSDIWSVGVVLYEMITGRLPFEGEYEGAAVYAIMHEEPEPLARYKTGVSQVLQSIIDKALDKDLETRYQNMADLLTDLKRERKSTSKITKPFTPGKKKSSKASMIALTLSLVVLLVIALIVLLKPPAKPVMATHQQITFTGQGTFPAISPDGQFIAYVAGKAGTEQKVMVQDMGGGRPLEVFKSQECKYLRWSPTGSELLFFAWNEGGPTGVYLVPRLGGNSRLIDSRHLVSWSSDGSQIASVLLTDKAIQFTDKLTGAKKAIKLSDSFTELSDLDWSPTGNLLLFMSIDKGQHSVWTIRPDGSQQQKVIEDSVALFSARWSAKGDAIYYLREKGQTKDLMKIQIATKTGKAKGPASVVLTGLQLGDYFTLSKDGKSLLYARKLEYSNLWLVTLEASGTKPQIRTKQLTTGTSMITRPSISPDGTRIAFSIGKYLAKANIFTSSIEGGPVQQITYLDSYNAGPVWSPDGQEIAFGSAQDGTPKVWIINANGGTPRPLAKSNLSESFLMTWSPGSKILYQRPDWRNFHILNHRSDKQRPLLQNATSGWALDVRYSPDGKKVAVLRTREGPTGIAEHEGIWTLSLEDSSQHLLAKRRLYYPIGWSSDGNWVYASIFEVNRAAIVRIHATSGEVTPVVTLPFEYQNEDQLQFNNIGMTPGGSRFVCTVFETQSDVWLVKNFDPEVK